MSADDLERRILHEADDLLAFDKPPDLPTSGRSLDDPDCLQWRLMERAGRPVWAVHQLDADTSGVNLFTTRRDLVEPLKRAMAAPGSAKAYVAWVHGVPNWTELSCIASIGPVDTVSLGVAPSGRAARTTLRVAVAGTSWARVEAQLGTGRTHQIRIHLAHLGHPLIGEEWYREPSCEQHPRQALHAVRLSLAAPFARTVAAPIPEDLVQLQEHLVSQGGAAPRGRGDGRPWPSLAGAAPSRGALLP